MEERRRGEKAIDDMKMRVCWERVCFACSAKTGFWECVFVY